MVMSLQDAPFVAAVISYGLLIVFSSLGGAVLLKGDIFMDDNKHYTIDTNSQLSIRATDNTPKEEDDFQKADQYNRPMTEDEIMAKIKEITG